jgi:AAA family ATPase
MSTDTAYPVRPFARSVSSIPENDLESAFRVHVNQELRRLGLANGDLIRLRTSSGFKGYATAWQASQLQKSPHVNVHEFLRERYGLPLKDPVFIEKAADSWKPLKAIEVSSSASAEHLAKFSSTEELSFWVRCALGKVSRSISSVWHACSNRA